MTKRLLAALLCIAFVVLLFENVFAQDQQQRSRRNRFPWAPSIEIGAPVPDFELPILDGGKFKLSEQKGKIVVFELGACT
ncbi:hypothetical protein ACFL6L_02565 [candidate division KSB1 bacterium]